MNPHEPGFLERPGIQLIGGFRRSVDRWKFQLQALAYQTQDDLITDVILLDQGKIGFASLCRDRS